MREYYVGFDTYDQKKISKLCADAEVRGVVLGDLFCTKRMFSGGIAEEIACISHVMKSGKTVIYQTPLYVTNRNMDEVMSVASMILEESQSHMIITEDIGVAVAVREKYPQARLIWGRMGRNREYRYNDDFLEMLKDSGFGGFETADSTLAGRVQEAGMKPFLLYGNLYYATMGRECYMKYQTGSCDRAACLSGNHCMKDKESNFKMSIDGYLLGERFSYGDQNAIWELAEKMDAQVIVYSGQESIKVN